MSHQCVPSWDLDNNYSAPARVVSVHAHSNSANSLAVDVPSLDYEKVSELTWENGQLAMHGLAAPRVGTTNTAWDKPRAGGTLESIVNQATSCHLPAAAAAGDDKLSDLVPWFDHRHAAVNPAPAAAAATIKDALVPCNAAAAASNNKAQYKKNTENQENSAHVLGPAQAGTGTCGVGCSTRVGSCSGAASVAARGGRAPRGRSGCASESATFGAAAGRESRQVTTTVDNTYSERGFGGGGLTSTSLWSPENTSSGGDYTRTSADDPDSVCQSRSQRGASGDRKRKAVGKSSVSTKTRAAAIHNQSERKRRDKINQRMKTLQKMVPNSSKTDKASMLDEVIEYLKQLQAQVHMMSRMNMPSMMMPLAMQQQQQLHQMSMMGLGMGIMDINTIGRATAAPMPPVVPAAAGFMPVPSWDIQGGDRLQSPDLLSAFLACQSQPMTIDAYSRLAALYQQLQQTNASCSKI